MTDDLADLENRVLDDPENPDLHFAGRQTDVDEGDRASRGGARVGFGGYEDRQDWSRAAQMSDRLVELSPDSITHPRSGWSWHTGWL